MSDTVSAYDFYVKRVGRLPQHREQAAAYATTGLVCLHGATLQRVPVDTGKVHGPELLERCAFCETFQPCDWFVEDDTPGCWACADEDACRARVTADYCSRCGIFAPCERHAVVS